MSLRKICRRFSGIADLKEQTIRLFHLFEEDFPGISFEFETKFPGQKKIVGRAITDTRGKICLDQNDGTPVPDDQISETIHGVKISDQVENVINEPRDKERNTNQENYDELTRWRFRKGQHKTVYIAYEANDENDDGAVRITFTDGTNPVVHEQTGITSSWNEYTDSKNISTLLDGWYEIILEAKSGVGIGYIYIRRFTITIRRT